MCLYITSTDPIKEPIKVLKECIITSCPSCHKYYVSSPYFHNCIWKKGIIKSDRKFTNITKIEKQWKRIEQGIHLWLWNSPRANNIRRYKNNCYITCYVQPNDFLAFGDKGDIVTNQILVSSIPKITKERKNDAVYSDYPCPKCKKQTKKQWQIGNWLRT